MLFFSRRRLPTEAAMPNISATAVSILAFRIVFMARLYSITQKSEISYAPATPGTVNDEPATYPATYPARAVKALPYAALHAVRLQIGCNLDAVRMQFGCGSDAVSLRLMQLCIQAGYSSDAVQKLSRHS